MTGMDGYALVGLDEVKLLVVARDRVWTTYDCLPDGEVLNTYWCE